MIDYQTDLKHILQLTEDVLAQAQAINAQMKENEAGQLEDLDSLFDKRGKAILRLDALMQQKFIRWNDEDRILISRLQQAEQQLQPLITGLHQAFLKQINRMNQTKQVSQKYIGAYQNMATDGSFIDKRN
ncbi:flagellar protein FliT [Planococcus sp. YIM B11945]|uniref:flagellar protein FliT n=1 Tax=Planococcus sp. YIM B11945 TaxID=3435410 RepID=UPI003D7E5498